MSKKGTNGGATLVFHSGLNATLIFKRISRGWETFVETKEGLKEPRSHESIIKCVAVMEALEKSASSQDWENVIL